MAKSINNEFNISPYFINRGVIGMNHIFPLLGGIRILRLKDSPTKDRNSKEFKDFIKKAVKRKKDIYNKIIPEALSRYESLVVFPENERNKKGEYNPKKETIMNLYNSFEKSDKPCYIIPTKIEYKEKEKKLFSRSKVKVTFFEKIKNDKYSPYELIDYLKQCYQK